MKVLMCALTFACSAMVSLGQLGTGELDAMGLVDIRLAGAVSDLEVDSTEAIQAAIDYAYANNKAVYFPPGEYMISDTLYCCQPLNADNRRRPGHTLIGAYDRPLIVLKNSLPAFGDPSNPKPMFAFWRSKTATDPVGETDYLSRIDNQNYNQIIRNLRLSAGSGNTGAVGVLMQGAEGCAVQDMRFDMDGGFAGLWQLSGSGGGTQGVEFYGGTYGIYATGAQPCPVVSGCYFENQTSAAVYYDANTPLTLVGFVIKREHSDPVFDGLWKRDSQRGRQEFWGNINLVDGQVEYGADANYPAVCLRHEDRAIYIKNVFFRGFERIIDNFAPEDARDYDVNPATWTRVNEFADSPALTRDIPRLVDGVKTYDAFVDISHDVAAPTTDFRMKHAWTYGLGCPDRDGVVSVKDFGAVGDGVADDTAAIKAALEASSLVYVPPGDYAISDTLYLDADTELFGLAGDKTRIRGTGFGSKPVLTPMIASPDDPDATTVLSSFTLDFNAPTKNVYPVLWQAGRRSVIRDIWPYPLEGPSAPFQRVWFKNNGGGRVYNIVQQQMTGGANTEYHHLKVEETHEPLTFYGMHNQHINTLFGSRVLFEGAKNITVFGLKHEHELGNKLPEEDWPVSVKVDRCRNVQFIGMSGLAETAPGRGLVEFVDSDDVLLANGCTWHNTATDEVLRDDFYVKEFHGDETYTIRAGNMAVASLFRRGQPTGAGGLYDHPEAVGYSTWIFGRVLDDESPEGDPDRDGLPNELEYALDGNPAVADAYTCAAFDIGEVAGVKRLRAVYTVNPQALSEVRAVFSTDLSTGDWKPGTIYSVSGSTVVEASGNNGLSEFGRLTIISR